MSGFDFVSPGAAFVGGVTDYLDNQKKLQRQALLDSLQVDANKRANEAAALQQQEAEQRMRDQQQTADINRLNAIGTFLDPGQDISGLQQGDQDLLRKYSAVKDTVTPGKPMPIMGLGGTPIGEIPGKETKTSTYVGATQARQHEKEVKDFGTSVIQTLLSSADPKDRQKGQAMVIDAMVNHGLPSAATVAKLMEPDVPVYVWDQNTGKFADSTGKNVAMGAVPSNAKILTRNYEPRQPIPRSWMQLNATNDKGEQLLFDPNTKETIAVPGSQRMGGKGTNSLDKFNIPSYALTPLAQSIGNLGLDPSNVDEGALADYRTRAAGAIAVSHASRPVQILANEYLNNPDAAYQHAAQMIDAGQLSEKDVSDLRVLTDGIAPNTVKDVLKANPYKPHVAKPGVGSRALSAIENFFGSGGSEDQ